MNEIVKKFGGTSVNNIRILKKIITKDDVVVVSAPGKRFDRDEKTTDLLEMIFKGLKRNEYINNYWEAVKTRFYELVAVTKADIDLGPYFKEIESYFSSNIDRDFLLSRGEFLTAIIFSRAFDMNFVDAGEVIKFKDGKLDMNLSIPLIQKMIIANTIVPGFYGKEEDKIRLLGRGGSDVTGAIIASSLNSKEYQNYGEENGVKMTLPNLLPHTRMIEKISYENMNTFSKCGAKILHPDAVKIAGENNIPLKVKSIFAPNSKATIVSNEDENRFVKAMGVKENSLKICMSLKNYNKHFFDIMDAFNQNNIVYQNAKKTNNIVELFAYSDEKIPSSKLSKLKKELEFEAGEKVEIEDTREIVLIIGESTEKYTLLKFLKHYLKAKNFDLKIVSFPQSLAIVVPPHKLKYFYQTLYSDFVDSFINQKVEGSTLPL